MGIVMTCSIAIIIIVIITYKWDAWSLKKVECRRSFNKERVFAGEEIIITSEIVNRKILPLPWIELHTEVPNSFGFKNKDVTSFTQKGSKQYNIVTSLFSFQRVKRHDTFICKKRGYYVIYYLEMKIGDFFGFRVANKNIAYPIKVIVYPNIKPLKNLLIPQKNPQGEVSVRRWIMPDPIDIIGSREYTSSDSFNTIDWKSTAKIGKLHVKKYNFTANYSIMIFLNVQTSKVHWHGINEKYIEKGIEVIASITHQATEENIPIGFTSNAYFIGENTDIFIKPKANKSQEVTILEALARNTYGRRIAIEELIKHKYKQIDKGSCVVLLTANISDELKKELNFLVKCGYIVKLITLCDECSVVGLNKNIEVIPYKTESILVG